ncbi:hypothetical protein BC829DRAFT_419970 [Chytridium lagenaria]|nr:hypothetical protein BC829DRAFT_419970 [Chytridium lagenaria]
MEEDSSSARRSWADMMDAEKEEDKGETPLTVKKRPRPDEIPDHPDDVGIIAERGIRFPKVAMEDVEIVDGCIKEPVSQTASTKSRNSRIEEAIMSSIKKCTNGKGLQELAKTIKPEDVTLPILNAFLQILQPLLQCPACEDCRSTPTKLIQSLLTPPVIETIPKIPQALHECKKDIKELFTTYAIDDKTSIPPVLKKLMQQIQKFITMSEHHTEAVTQLCMKIAKENLALKQSEFMGGQRHSTQPNYLAAAKKAPGRKSSPTTQAIQAIEKLAPAVQQEHLDRLAEHRRNPVTNAPLRQREPAIKRAPTNIQSAEDITNPLLREKVQQMQWTVIENLPGENRTVIRQYLKAQGMPTHSIINIRMMGNRTEVTHHGEAGKTALDALIERVPRIKRVVVDQMAPYAEGPNKDELTDRHLNILARDMVQAHDMAFIIATYLYRIPPSLHETLIAKTSALAGIKPIGRNGPELAHGVPARLRLGSLNDSKKPLWAPDTRIYGYEDYVPFDTRQPPDNNSGLSRRGISIMRNPATTSADDFTLIEKDPDGDFIWFRFRGIVRIAHPTLQEKLASIRQMQQRFPTEHSIILGDFNTRLGNPHNGDLRGSPEWQKSAFIDSLEQGNLEIIHNPQSIVPPWTFQRSGLGSGNSIIDYIAVSSGLRAATGPLKTERQTPVDTDHKLIWIDLLLPNGMADQPRKTQPFSHGRLKDPAIHNRYKECCENIKDETLTAIRAALEGGDLNNISDRTALEVVDKALEALTTPLAKVLEEVLGRRNPNKTPKADSCWDEEMQGLARERLAALHKRNDTYSWSPLYAQAEEELEKARRKLQRTLRKKKTAGYRKWTEELHTASPPETVRRISAATRRRNRHTKSSGLKNDEEALETARQHFAKASSSVHYVYH